MKRLSRRLAGQVLCDIVLVNLALLLALALRFEFHIPFSLHSEIKLAAWLAPPVYLASFYVFHLYRLHWRYIGLRDTLALMVATACGTGIQLLLSFMPGFPALPISVFLLHGILTGLFVTGLRVALRILDWELRRQKNGQEAGPRRQVLVVGAGDTGELVARDVLRQSGYRLAGFVDDDPNLKDQRIHGVWVLGRTEDIPQIVEKHDIDDILIAIPSAASEVKRRIVSICEQTPARIRILPGLPQILHDQVTMQQFRDVQLEDLLGRPPVQIDTPSVAGYLQGQRVLVTGAGGSIGSELCRQIASMQPQCLVLLGHGENSIYEIQQELLRSHPELPVEAWIADVKDRRRLEYIFHQTSPTVVFHAAAHKHVPMMESNTVEAIRNNVLGVLNVANVCVEHGIKKMVFISTDKAVNPSSVMGATKRVGEMIIQCISREHTNTGFAIVRFGNVLGSRGSLVPTLQNQIARGGPVTVTHPQMRRFFMTIPEAVMLVLQAGSMGDKGEVFVLDMGEPVYIVDIAEHLIRLSGFTPGHDMAVVFTGVRPGEKLEEELFTQHEETAHTTHPKITVVCQPNFHPALIMKRVEHLLNLAADYDVPQARQALMELAHTPLYTFVESNIR